MKRSLFFMLRGPLLCVPSVRAPRNYSNAPYTKEPADEFRRMQRSPPPLVPPPMRTNYIDRQPLSSNVSTREALISYRHASCACTDVSMRPLATLKHAAAPAQATVDNCCRRGELAYGERLAELACRWAAKFYGQVTFGPRNYPYPSSRWLARRFQMKKHRILKRFRFRRYKLAAVANLPFAKMIRVGMLPELKSSKTKKGDTIDAGLHSQLVTAAKTTSGGKVRGRRTRPKSKYQV